MIIAQEVADKAHLQSRNRVKREKALRGPVPTVYCGAGEELVGCLRWGMLSRDAMGWAGCRMQRTWGWAAYLEKS